MRIVVYPHDLAVGGSQINAIDLGAAVRDLGHDVFVYGLPGPLIDHVADRGLPFIAAPAMQYRPAPQRIAHLLAVSRRERIDVIHGYEWPPCLDAYFGAHLMGRVGLTCTVLSMAVSPLVPRSVPLLMGTEDLADAARAAGHRSVSVLEPPIDVDGDHPGIDGSAVRESLGLDAGEQLVVTVSRLAIDLKLDALERAIAAVGAVARRRPIRLLVVGGGEADRHLRSRAADVDAACGRQVIHFAGEQLDPRPYYAAADVVVGMGSSALRAMAIGRPVVVQGEHGFSLPCEPATIGTFLRQGFWGVGDDGPIDPLVAGLERLLDDPALRDELGDFGRRSVVGRFALPEAARRLEAHYAELAEQRSVRRPLDVATTAGRAAVAELRLHDPRRQRIQERQRKLRLTA